MPRAPPMAVLLEAIPCRSTEGSGILVSGSLSGLKLPSSESAYNGFFSFDVDHGRSDWLGCGVEVVTNDPFYKTGLFTVSFTKQPNLAETSLYACLSESPVIYGLDICLIYLYKNLPLLLTKGYLKIDVT